MKQDMIVILDLGSHENTVLARAIRALGVYSEIYPHDITVEELKALPNVKGIIINGGPNNVIDGVAIDVNPGIYSIGIPVMAAGHDKALCEVKLNEFSSDMEAIKESVKTFVFDTCKAEANWNMTNFVNDQIELVRRQVGDRKVLLALSGGVDSSVVAALLLKAIGDKLVCVHVNHGLMRKGESENVVEVFKNQLNANLIYKDVTDRFLDKLAGVADPEDQQDQRALQHRKLAVAGKGEQRQHRRKQETCLHPELFALHRAGHTDQRKTENQSRVGRNRPDGVAHGDIRIALQRRKDGNQHLRQSGCKAHHRAADDKLGDSGGFRHPGCGVHKEIAALDDADQPRRKQHQHPQQAAPGQIQTHRKNLSFSLHRTKKDFLHDHRSCDVLKVSLPIQKNRRMTTGESPGYVGHVFATTPF